MADGRRGGAATRGFDLGDGAARDTRTKGEGKKEIDGLGDYWLAQLMEESQGEELVPAERKQERLGRRFCNLNTKTEVENESRKQSLPMTWNSAELTRKI